MTILRRITIALLSAALLATGAANAASTTNYSDQWWVGASEDGWGASVLQQWDVLFIDIFVYGADGKPTWFTAAAFHQPNAPAGHDLFTGDLYATTGPYFGGAFNPGAVGRTVVGTLTFDATAVNNATLSYTVSGVPVVKNVTRQTWRNDNISGSYYGGESGDQTLCGADNGHYEEMVSYLITHNPDNSVTIKWVDPQGRTLTINGIYSQAGHMGQIIGTVSDPGRGINGTGNFFEIERTISGISGRGHMTLHGSASCVWDGRWGGVRR